MALYDSDDGFDAFIVTIPADKQNKGTVDTTNRAIIAYLLAGEVGKSVVVRQIVGC